MARADASNLYETDFYTWTQVQAQALRQRLIEDLDLPHLAEEIEDMGKSTEDALESRFEVLLTHLLKWAYQPDARSKSWRLTIKEQRRQVGKLLKKNPGLKPKVLELFEAGYEGARLQAAKETPLEENDFPAICPWSFEQAADENFFPDAPAR